FEGETTSHVIVAIMEKEPQPLSVSLPEAPAELQRIVTKALRKDREERYQNIKDLQLDLKNFRQEIDLKAQLGRMQPANQPQRQDSPLKRLAVVLLYKRKAQPDEQLLQALEARLTAIGHDVFIDRHLKIGVEWAQAIEGRIRSSDA